MGRPLPVLRREPGEAIDLNVTPTDEPSLYVDMPTQTQGLAVITDHEVVDSHWDFAAGVSDTPPSRALLLSTDSSILTISFPSITPMLDGAARWYAVARPMDLRRGSRLRNLFDRHALSSEVDRTQPIFFNDEDIETRPGTLPPIAELGHSLLALSAAVN